MLPLSINIEVSQRDIPQLVCTEYSLERPNAEYASAIAQAVADVLGVQDFLSKPGRVNELRRKLREMSPCL